MGYNGIATSFNFSFGGSTGFTYNIIIGWENFSLSATTYVCGDSSPVQNSSVLYDNLN